MVEPTGFHRTITERALVEDKRFRVKKEGTRTPEPKVSLDTADVVIDGMTLLWSGGRSEEDRVRCIEPRVIQ